MILSIVKIISNFISLMLF